MAQDGPRVTLDLFSLWVICLCQPLGGCLCSYSALWQRRHIMAAYSPGLYTSLLQTKVQRCSLFFSRMYMSQRRRQTFVLGLLFFLFSDLISVEIETPAWPAAKGEANMGKYLTCTTVSTKFTSSGLRLYLFSYELACEIQCKPANVCQHRLYL